MVQSIEKKVTATKFDTFQGVFIPAILAIFGAVVYYITPRLLGGLGLLKMLALLLIAHSVTLATSYSISGIATNIRVKGGGLYYLISRSLGTEFGGSMGIQLFLAQAISISFYTIAFAKAVASVFIIFGYFPNEIYIALISYVGFWIIAFIGARFVIKIQFYILIAILVSFVSIFLGPNIVIEEVSIIGQGGIPLGFWAAFTMFFTAVTGMDAGVGMSGDLKNPRKSLVKGTFGAVIFTMIVYIALVLKYYFSASLMDLSVDQFIVQKIALIPELVIIGVLMSTSSSALSYLMTAPRTLRAMVNDKIFSPKLNFLAKTIGNSTEPRVAMFLNMIIGLSIILIGDLFIVSQIIGIFFLTVYGWINGAALLEKLSKNPSYRPSFNSPTIFSFYGMIACYFIMFLFNPWVMFANIAFQLGVFYILTKSERSIKVESVWDGVWFQSLRWVLNQIEDTEKSKKNWRPTIVSFCINQRNKTFLAALLDWIGSSSSITKLYMLISKRQKGFIEKKENTEEDLRKYVKEYDLNIFPRVLSCKDYNETFNSVIQSETIGNVPMNTVVLDFDEKFSLDHIINNSIEQGKNIIILRNIGGFSEFKRVDVWWHTPINGNLMMLLAYLITHSKKWREEDATIRVFNIVDDANQQSPMRDKLNKIIADARLENAIVEILVKDKKVPNQEMMYKISKDSDLVIVGLPRTSEDYKTTKTIHKEIKRYTDKLSTSLIVYGANEFDLKVS